MADKIDEVKDPGTRGRLEGVQSVVYDLDLAIKQTKELIAARKAAAGQTHNIAEMVFQHCVPINHLVDKGEMEPDEAKLRVDTIKQVVKSIQDTEAEIRAEVERLNGKVEGLEASVAVAGARFNNEALKYERHERMAQEDEEERAAMDNETLEPTDEVVEGEGEGEAAH